MANGSGRVGTGEPHERFDRTEFRDSGGVFAYRVGQEAGSYFFEFRQQGAKQQAPSSRAPRSRFKDAANWNTLWEAEPPRVAIC